MGIGLVWLLRRIEKYRSINRAAADMKMSYAKALKILNRLEKNLEHPVLIRRKGGMVRGGAELTPYGKKFLEIYDRLQKDICRQGRDIFKAFKSEMEEIDRA